MNLDDLAHSLATLLREWVTHPLAQFLAHQRGGDPPVLYAVLASASLVGFMLGRRRSVPRVGDRPDGGLRIPQFRNVGARTFTALRLPQFQNSGEPLVSRVVRSHFRPPHFHLLNHVTLQMADGTTQVDHILVS